MDFAEGSWRDGGEVGIVIIRGDGTSLYPWGFMLMSTGGRVISPKGLNGTWSLSPPP